MSGIWAAMERHRRGTLFAAWGTAFVLTCYVIVVAMTLQAGRSLGSQEPVSASGFGTHSHGRTSNTSTGMGGRQPASGPGHPQPAGGPPPRDSPVPSHGPSGSPTATPSASASPRPDPSPDPPAPSPTPSHSSRPSPKPSPRPSPTHSQPSPSPSPSPPPCFVFIC